MLDESKIITVPPVATLTELSRSYEELNNRVPVAEDNDGTMQMSRRAAGELELLPYPADS